MNAKKIMTVLVILVIIVMGFGSEICKAQSWDFTYGSDGTVTASGGQSFSENMVIGRDNSDSLSVQMIKSGGNLEISVNSANFPGFDWDITVPTPSALDDFQGTIRVGDLYQADGQNEGMNIVGLTIDGQPQSGSAQVGVNQATTASISVGVNGFNSLDYVIQLQAPPGGNFERVNQAGMAALVNEVSFVPEAAPEPASWALGIVAFGMFGFVCYRQRKGKTA